MYVKHHILQKKLHKLVWNWASGITVKYKFWIHCNHLFWKWWNKFLVFHTWAQGPQYILHSDHQIADTDWYQRACWVWDVEPEIWTCAMLCGSDFINSRK